MKRVFGGLLLVATVALAGCGGGGGGEQAKPSPSPTQSSSGQIGIPPGETPGDPTYPPGKEPMAISLARTGGVAGVDQRIQVTVDGAWTYSEDGKKETGQLTDQQVSKLQSLAMDKGLRTEAKIKDRQTCADGFQYDLRAGSVSMTATDCGGQEGRPAFAALVDYLVDATPM
ncbi:MAG: hypothetical protein ACRDTU_01500 [Micromonosporaceae bacterium]